MTRQVLLICANPRQAARVQVALLRYGRIVEVASTFRRGLAVIRHRPPTLIVVDEALPDLDKSQLAQALAASSARAMPTVVILPLQKLAAAQDSTLGDGQSPGDLSIPGDRIMTALWHKGVF